MIAVGTERLTDAVDRLLDVLEQYQHHHIVERPALREAVSLVYRAYCREKRERGELVSEFPDLELRLEQ